MSEEIRDLCSPCGLDCFNCELYFKNITEDFKQLVAVKTGRKPEEIPCRGCRAEREARLKRCESLKCIVRHDVEFCFECPEFPCPFLAPSKDGAELFPHNMKVYNLCRMRAIGVEQWAAQEAATIRALYYKGKFVPGRGPVLDKG